MKSHALSPDRRTIDRGILLFQQGRHADAEREFRRALAENAGDAAAHAWLAMTLLELKRLDEAEREAGDAIGHGPALPWAHFAMAATQRTRGRLARAHASIDEAIALDGGLTPAYHASKGQLFLMQSRHRDALACADAALAIDPSDDVGMNVRALAQTQLGLKREAVETIRGALANNPEDAFTHANHGWAMLHQNRPKEALDHFGESLKLDPGNSFARAGLVEALKARNPIYRVMLAYFLWIGRQTGAVRMIVFVGALLGPRLFRTIGNQYPQFAVPASILAGLLVAFILMTWLAVPIFDSMLRLHPRGRHALDDDQRRGSNLFLGAIAFLLLIASVGIITRDVFWPLVAAVGALILLPLSAVFQAPSGWPRATMVAIVFVLVAMLTTVVVSEVVYGRFLVGLLTLYSITAFISQFVALSMVRQREKRG